MCKMNTLEAIAQRRSIRKFKDTDISEETIETILDAAIQAPSGKNRQPWSFVVVRKKDRDEMIRIMRESINKLEKKETKILVHTVEPALKKLPKHKKKVIDLKKKKKKKK